MVANDKCWFFLLLPNLYLRTLDLQQKPRWITFTVRVVHCVDLLHCSSQRSPAKHSHPASLPSLGALWDHKWKWLEGCLSKAWKSLTVRSQKPLQSSSLFPAGKSKQKATQGPLTYVLWQILLKQLKAFPAMHTAVCIASLQEVAGSPHCRGLVDGYLADAPASMINNGINSASRHLETRNHTTRIVFKEVKQ